MNYQECFEWLAKNNATIQLENRHGEMLMNIDSDQGEQHISMRLVAIGEADWDVILHALNKVCRDAPVA